MGTKTYRFSEIQEVLRTVRHTLIAISIRVQIRKIVLWNSNLTIQLRVEGFGRKSSLGFEEIMALLNHVLRLIHNLKCIDVVHCFRFIHFCDKT